MAITDMNEYERKAWRHIEDWRVDRLKSSERRLLPQAARTRLERASDVAKDRFDQIPGSGQLVDIVRSALDGLLSLVNRTAEATMRRGAVVNAYNKRGHAITDLAEIQNLDLRVVDKVKPRLGLRYTAASTVEGAAAGLAVSGGEILAAGGTIFGAGAGAAPGAGTVAGAMAADAAAVLLATTRAVAHTAAYYGYDTEQPEERIFALGVLNFGLAGQASKNLAYVELNKIVQSLARRAAWDQLNRNGVTQIVKIVYETLGMRLTKQKLGQAVPVVGIAIGAGLNARLLANVTSDADHLYRERFLREKYGLQVATVAAPLVDVVAEDTVHIAEIVEAELEDEAAKRDG